MGENGVMRTKNHPPPVAWESPKSFFGNGGGYSIRANHTKKALQLSARLVLSFLWLLPTHSKTRRSIATFSTTAAGATAT